MNKMISAETVNSINTDLVSLTKHISQNYLAPITKEQDFKEEPKLFLYTVLYKLTNGLNSCRHFINLDPGWQRDLEGLLLILRTLISDSLITNYVIRKDYKKDSDIVNNIRPLYTDHLKFGLENLNKYGQKFWQYSPQEIAAEDKKIKQNFSEYFNRDGSFKYKRDRTSMGAKAEYLFDNIDKDGLKLLIVKAHNLYMFFSKYEHLGVLSLPLMMRQYDEKSTITIFRQVVEAIMVVGHTINLSLHIWHQFDVEADQILQSLILNFDKHRTTLITTELAG